MTDAGSPPTGPQPSYLPPAGAPSVQAQTSPPLQPIYVHLPRRANWALRIVLIVLIAGVVFTLILAATVGAALGTGDSGSFATRTVREGDKSQVVAVYDISDMIDARQADRFRAFARQVRRDDNVKAVVLRIDSGGGSVSASDEMHQEVRRMQKAKRKVVVAMGGTAASGGYYISAPADYIFAEPTTVTGSIGVISIIPIIKGTLAKIGAETLILRSTPATPRKADLNPFEAPTPQAIAEHQALLDQIHERFVKVVQDGRPALSSDEVVKLANGRVWIAQEAMDLKLVDEIGYQDDAIAKAAALAGLSNPKAVRYTERHTLAELFQARSTGLMIDSRLIEDLQTPRMMLLWRPQWQ
jgi:protease IV